MISDHLSGLPTFRQVRDYLLNLCHLRSIFNYLRNGVPVSLVQLSNPPPLAFVKFFLAMPLIFFKPQRTQRMHNVHKEKTILALCSL
jgi:hypothetical protein